jgi:hypothetical protein
MASDAFFVDQRFDLGVVVNLFREHERIAKDGCHDQHNRQKPFMAKLLKHWLPNLAINP